MSEKYLIVGAGRSGICSGQLLSALGKDFVIFDGNADLDKKAVSEKIGCDKEIEFILGTAEKEQLQGIDICVVSPGVPLETDIMQKVISAGIPVWSEIELAYLYDKGEIIGITGTNGKTTTTSLVYEIVKAHNENTLLVGNIEIPYTGRVLDSVDGGATVAEISSFQLETMITFKPKVSAILNITPDHLDRHKTMENYADVKKSIAKNQTADEFCVLNYDDEVLRAFAKDCKCTITCLLGVNVAASFQCSSIKSVLPLTTAVALIMFIPPTILTLFGEILLISITSLSIYMSVLS